MKAKLYVLRGAHPSRSAMLMLDHKGIDYETVTLPAGFQPYVIRQRDPPDAPQGGSDGHRPGSASR